MSSVIAASITLERHTNDSPAASTASEGGSVAGTNGRRRIIARQAQLTSAQAALDKLKQPATATDVNAAKAQLTSAQAAYQAAVDKDAHKSDQLMAAKATLDKALATLQQAQAAYDAIAWRDNPPGALAGEVAGEYQDGVCWVDLAGLLDGVYLSEDGGDRWERADAPAPAPWRW